MLFKFTQQIKAVLAKKEYGDEVSTQTLASPHCRDWNWPAIRMIRELGDLGVNAIDTAEQYSNSESERLYEAGGMNECCPQNSDTG